LDELARNGKAPTQAMEDFAKWVARTTGDATPVFVGFNAPFDWSFINYYFHHFLGHNPFGFAALDIKSLYMGLTGCSWRDTRSSEVVKALQPQLHGNHNALDDALAQAEWFQLIRAKQQLGQLKDNQK
jgi:DNA polymerase III epsilon subunit-like protein